MSYEPKQSFQSISGVIDTSFYQTIVLVGNSNVATAGIHKDLELLTEQDIATKFGAGQHLASMIEEIRYQMRNSLTKPKIMARSYQDGGLHTSNVKAITFSGTATRDSIFKVYLGSNAPSNIASGYACAIASRHTIGANVGQFDKNIFDTGSPKQCATNTSALLAPKILSVEVSISKGADATAVASAINTAIGALSNSPFTSSATSGVLTITSKTKGIVANELGIKIDTIEGVSASIAETAGTGTVDISAVLDTTDIDGKKLKELDFDAIVIPYGYATSNIVDDAHAKMENVTNYGNKCLDYRIYQATAIDTNDDSAINTLSSNNPTSSKGAVRVIGVLHKTGGFVTGISSVAQATKIKNKQLNPIYDLSNKLEFGSQITLSDVIGFYHLNIVLNSMMVRYVYVEKFLDTDYWRKNYTTGNSDSFNVNKAQVILDFLLYYDILSGTIADLNNYSKYSNISNFTNIVVRSDLVRANYEKLLDSTISFNNGQLSVSFINEFSKPITLLNLIHIIT